MTICKEYCSVEQCYLYEDENGNQFENEDDATKLIPVCSQCGSPEIGEYDEDYGRDR